VAGVSRVAPGKNIILKYYANFVNVILIPVYLIMLALAEHGNVELLDAPAHYPTES